MQRWVGPHYIIALGEALPRHRASGDFERAVLCEDLHAALLRGDSLSAELTYQILERRCGPERRVKAVMRNGKWEPVA